MDIDIRMTLCTYSHHALVYLLAVFCHFLLLVILSASPSSLTDGAKHGTGRTGEHFPLIFEDVKAY